MRNETIVINTGPLILLDKIEALDVFGKLPVQFICPSAVRQEIDAKKLKIISSLWPYAARLIDEGARYSPKLIAGVLSTVGE